LSHFGNLREIRKETGRKKEQLEKKKNRLLSPKNEQKKLTVKVNCNPQLHPNKI
jgi:hypothetical protein